MVTRHLSDVRAAVTAHRDRMHSAVHYNSDDDMSTPPSQVLIVIAVSQDSQLPPYYWIDINYTQLSGVRGDI